MEQLLPYLFGLAPRGAYQNLKFEGGAKPRWGANLRGGHLAKLQEKYKTIFQLHTKTKIQYRPFVT